LAKSSFAQSGDERRKVNVMRPISCLVSILVLMPALAQPQTISKPTRRPNPVVDRILAAERGETPEVQALLAGTDANARDAAHKRTALMWSIQLNDQAAFQRFINAGADVNAVDASHETALDFAVEFAMQYDTTAIVEALLAKGADPMAGAGSGGGMAPLIHAANANSVGVTRALLAKIDPKTIDGSTSDGMTALIAAASVGARDVAYLLLEKGASIDRYDLQGRTPLIHAASKQFPGTTETVKLLLEMGANPTARDKDGHTALSEAQQRGSADVIALLKKAGAQ
jgi:serine/threonine-protein phosphatase 6 regulatory ankyrin repeat subunit B